MGEFFDIMDIGGVVRPYLAGQDPCGQCGRPGRGVRIVVLIFGILALVGGAIALFMVNPERDKVRLMPSSTAEVDAN